VIGYTAVTFRNTPVGRVYRPRLTIRNRSLVASRLDLELAHHVVVLV
jgi:hypothetical protein